MVPPEENLGGKQEEAKSELTFIANTYKGEEDEELLKAVKHDYKQS